MVFLYRLFIGAIERLIAALVDPPHGRRNVVLLLTAYALVWTLYAALANASNDLPVDMGEAVIWSRNLAFGYHSEPPLMAWIAWLWFAVFPLTDWTFYLLSMALAAVALGFAWALLGDYVPSEKRVAGLAVLSLVPFYNIQALKFNADSVLLAFWAATTFWFLRALRGSDIKYAALAGLGAGACMLGKYWSVMLIGGLALAVLVSQRRRAFFRSPAPWVMAAVGAFVFMPNLVWLWTHDFGPILFDINLHAATGSVSVLERAVNYVKETGAAAAAPVMLVLLAALPDIATGVDMIWPREAERRVLVVACVAPMLVLPIAFALVFNVAMAARWAIPTIVLLPVVLLSPAGITLNRSAVTHLVALAVVFPLAMVVLAPAIAAQYQRSGKNPFIRQFRLVAQQVDLSWRDATRQPMRLFGSGSLMIDGVAVYLADRPSTFNVDAPTHTPWANEDRIARDGIALVCWLGDRICLSRMEALTADAPTVRRRDIELSRPFLGIEGVWVGYRIAIILPRGNPP